MGHSLPGIAIRRKFKFQRFGRTHHLKIETFEDLEAVLDLDEAHWVATTAPIATINCDPVFLSLMDTDNDNRVRAEEVKDAIRFLSETLSDRSGIVPGNTHLNLDMIDTQSEIGKRIHTAASKIITRTQSSQPYVTLENVRAIKAEVVTGGLDEAGIVLPEAATNDRLRKFINDIVATVGGIPHQGGAQGIDEDCLKRFSGQCRQYLDWLHQAAPKEDTVVSEILPLGASTHEAYELFSLLENKIAQFFLLCGIQQLDPELLVSAFSSEDGTLAMNVRNVAAAEAYLADAPLSSPNAERTLNLSGNVNPYYGRELKRFAEIALKPLLGQNVKSLDPSAWHRLKELFLPYGIWLESKPEVAVAKLKAEEMKMYVGQSFFTDSVKKLIEKSHRTAFVLDNIRELERLILNQAYILPFLNSFVSFPQLYDPESRALFEMGTLVMDGRHFTLAVKVLDREHHVQSSIASNIFVMYIEIYGQNNEKQYEVAVPVTSGSRGNIRLNKWGIFNDVSGQEWHAKVVHIIENPISVTEAMIHPFVRMSHAFMLRLEEVSIKTEDAIGFRVPAGDSKTKAGAGKVKNKGEVSSASWLAGGGVAIAALGSSAAFITQTVAKLSTKIVLGAILAIILAIVIPTALSAYYKLSKRDLSAILEGSGWGVNARMKLTRGQARAFTHRPDYPIAGS